MKYEFKIVAFTEDPDFSISLATECNKYGFSLTFIDTEDRLKEEINSETIIVVLIDLNNVQYVSMNLCEKIKRVHGIPVFGVLDMFNKKKQQDAKKSGFDLIFTKKMLLKSIKEVVVHVSNE
tara:strand:+ start:232 stop:597 length:366 start_codon:yes stop_codon:yes gene_type:complete